MPLFGPKTKSPQELVKTVKESMAVILRDKGSEKETKKAMEELGKTLVSMRSMLYTGGEQEASTEQLSQLAVEMYSNDILPLLVTNLQSIEFEGRKDVVTIFNNVVRRQIGNRNPTVEYLCTKPDLLMKLMKGYETHEIALNCGQMLRECCRAEELVKIMMNSPNFYLFFDYVELTTFEIASDAFSTFKDLLTRHKMLSATFLEQHYDTFFTRYSKLLCSENYVTRRQALKLLGELLLDRHNFTIMTRYISSPDNLKVMMTMLKDKSRNIQFEAFHVFKVFVANPNKPQPILDILTRNRDKLVDFLSSFHTDRSEDEQFNDEKSYLVRQIKDLKPLASSVNTTSNAANTTTNTNAASPPSSQSQEHAVDPGLCQRQN